MNDIKVSLLTTLKDFCIGFYAQNKEKHPEFLLDAYADKLRVATSIVNGTESEYFWGVAQEYAGELTVQEWAAAVIQADHTYLASRAALATLYTTASTAIVGAEEGTELQVATTVFTQAKDSIVAMSSGDPTIAAWVNTEIYSISKSLGLIEDTES